MFYMQITEYSKRKACNDYGDLIIKNPDLYEINMLNLCSSFDYDTECLMNIYTLKNHVIDGVNNNKTLTTICNEIKSPLKLSHYLFSMFLLLI